MVNHGISTAALMLVAGFLITRRGSRLIADYGGVQKVAPLLAGTFMIGGLATLSLPGLAPFVSEFLVLVGTFTRYPVLGIIATVGIVLAALYVLVLYQRTMTGPVKAGIEGMKDLKVRELVVVAPLIALLLFLGVYPKPLTDVDQPRGQGHALRRPQDRPRTADQRRSEGEREVSATAHVHDLLATGVTVPMAAGTIPTPKIEYAQLSPVLIVFGAAIIGILAEAFLPRALPLRRPARA